MFLNTFHSLDKQRNINKHDFEHGKNKPRVLPFWFQTSSADQKWACNGTMMPVLRHYFLQTICVGFSLVYYYQEGLPCIGEVGVG